MEGQAHAEKAEAEKSGDGMKLIKHASEARVTVELCERSLIDLRIAGLDLDPHAPQGILDAANLRTEPTKNGPGIRGFKCFQCGATELTETNEPAVVLVAGSYHTQPSENRPTQTRCLACGFGQKPSELFSGLLGASAKKLNALKAATHIEARDFPAVRFDGRWRVGESFMDVVRSRDFELPRAFDQHGFSGVAINAPNKEIATRALHHADWSDEWAVPIEVDRKARPLALPWSRPCVTDASAIAESQHGVRSERELEIKRQLRLVEAELRSEAGLR